MSINPYLTPTWVLLAWVGASLVLSPNVSLEQGEWSLRAPRDLATARKFTWDHTSKT